MYTCSVKRASRATSHFERSNDLFTLSGVYGVPVPRFKDLSSRNRCGDLENESCVTSKQIVETSQVHDCSVFLKNNDVRNSKFLALWYTTQVFSNRS